MSFDVKSKPQLIALAVVIPAYFAVIRLGQDFLYHLWGLTERPSGLFPSLGPRFMVAEPLEIPLYLLGYVVIPAVAFWLSPLAARLRLPRIPWGLLAAVSVVAALGLAGIAWMKLPISSYLGRFLTDPGHSLWLLFTKRIFVLYLVLGLSAIFFVLWYRFGKPWSLASLRLEAVMRKLWPAWVVLVAFVVFNPNYPLDPHHYNYFMGAVNDLREGKPILYESSHLYGLLNVYFLAALFTALPFTYESLSLVTAGFFLLFGFGIFWFLRKWLGRFTPAILGSSIILSILYLFQTSPTRSALFFPAMTPLRYWLYLPVLFLVLAFERTAKMRYLHLSLLTCAIAVFWNFDSGMYLSAATLATYGYFFLRGNWNWRRVFFLALHYIFYVGVVFVVINLANYLAFGSWPNWSLFFRETGHFTRGAGMYPLPILSIYQIFVFIYLAVLGYAAASLRRREQYSVISLPLLFVATYGAFFLIYYIGESTWQVMYVAITPFALILCYLAARWPGERLVHTAFATLVFFAGLLAVLKLPVEFSGRNYAKAFTNLSAVAEGTPELYQDAQILASLYPEDRLPLLYADENEPKILIYAQKTNWFDFYYTFTVYFDYEMDEHITKVKQDRPPRIFLGKVRDDRLEYFVARISDLYEVTPSPLQTLDVYQLKN